MSAPGSSPSRGAMGTVLRVGLLVGLLILGAVDLVRGLGHLLSEDSAAAQAGVAASSVTNPDVVYLFAVVGGTQALIGIVLIAAAVVAPAWRTVAVGLEAARCAVTLGVGLAKPSTADELVGGVPDVAQLVLALLLLVVLLTRPRFRSVT